VIPFSYETEVPYKGPMEDDREDDLVNLRVNIQVQSSVSQSYSYLRSNLTRNVGLPFIITTKKTSTYQEVYNLIKKHLRFLLSLSLFFVLFFKLHHDFDSCDSRFALIEEEKGPNEEVSEETPEDAAEENNSDSELDAFAKESSKSAAVSVREKTEKKHISFSKKEALDIFSSFH